MYRYFERNGKKILAVLGVFLMVAFIIPTGFRNTGGRTRGRAVGKLGKATVYSTDMDAAKDEWGVLTTRVYGGREFAFSRMGPVLAGFPGQMGMPGRPGEIDNHPDLFYLLSREAEDEGIRVSDDLINTIVTNEFALVAPSVNQNALHDAVRRVLMIGVLRDRIGGSVHVSEPALLHENASQWQSVRLNLVEFPASEFKSTVPAPTTQQVQEQFDKFKTMPPDTQPSPADPLAFGYEVPTRVQLQYIAIPHQQVIDAVKAGKSAYDWEVAAREYYLEHQQDFVRAVPTTAPSTQPAATQPATQASATTQPATQPAVASTQPTTRPFAEVQQEILDKLMAPDAEKLAKDVTDAVQKRIATAYADYAKSHPTTGPSTQPAQAAAPTTQSAAYDSYGFLESVASEIQKQYKVLPEVHQVAEWQDAAALAKLPGIGTAHTADGFTPFAKYATTGVAESETGASAGKLQVLQPSTVLSDSSKSNYLFRLTAIDPAHAPDLKEITARVEEDARTKEAFAAAVDNARKLLEQAQKQGLSAAAVAAHRQVTSTGSFQLDRPFIPNFIANPRALNALVGKARALLAEATPDHPHPVAMVEMPSERKVVVAELADVSLDASPNELFVEKLRAREQNRMLQTVLLDQKWFAYDAVTSRLNWQPEQPEKGS